MSKAVPRHELLHILHFTGLFHDVKLSSIHLQLYLASSNKLSAASSALVPSLTSGIPGPSIEIFMRGNMAYTDPVH